MRSRSRDTRSGSPANRNRAITKPLPQRTLQHPASYLWGVRSSTDTENCRSNCARKSTDLPREDEEVGGFRLVSPPENGLGSLAKLNVMTLTSDREQFPGLLGSAPNQRVVVGRVAVALDERTLIWSITCVTPTVSLTRVIAFAFDSSSGRMPLTVTRPPSAFTKSETD